MFRVAITRGVPGRRFRLAAAKTNSSLIRRQLSGHGSREKEGAFWIPLLVKAFPVVTFCLGTWQLYRLQWKLGLIEDAEKGLQQEAVTWDVSDFRQIKDGEPHPADMKRYQRMRIRGEMLPVEILVGPRTRNSVQGGAGKSGGMFSGPTEDGFIVLTPFRLLPFAEEAENQAAAVDNKTHSWWRWLLGRKTTQNDVIKEPATTRPSNEPEKIIFLHRGWIPTVEATPEARAKRHIAKPITLDTLYIPPPPFTFSQVVTPRNRPEDGTWHKIDMDEMTNYVKKTVGGQVECLPIMLGVLESERNRLRPWDPVAHPVRVHLRNEHLGYALTWYGMCLFSTFAVWGLKKRIAFDPLKRVVRNQQVAGTTVGTKI